MPLRATAIVLGIFLGLHVHAQESLSVEQAERIAQEIIAQSDPTKQESLIAQHRASAKELILAWTKGLTPGDRKTQYERIPSIWRAAILAVRDSQIRQRVLPELVDLALPTGASRMRDWQHVVLGGAIINGLGLENLWPKTELEKLLAEHPEWKPRWERALELAKSDATDATIPAGTRYDAIRVLAMLPADQAVARILPFLDDSNTDAAIKEELQMGAVSGLSDIEDPRIFEPLLSAYPKLAKGNQVLASQAMQRTAQRKLAWEIYQSDQRQQLYSALPMTLDHTFTEGIEGPASDAIGNVYAVNYQKQQTIGKVDRWGNGSVWVELPGKGTGNGIVFDSQGDLYVADYVEHKIWRVDRVTGKLSLHCHEPAMNQPNDLAIADDGTLYASDPNWNNGTGRVWRIDRRGIASIAADSMGTTNGIDVSPDGKYLSVNESQQRKIWRFEIRQDGTLGEKSLFKEFPDHGFDGMRYDQEGNLYVTRYGKGTVVVLSPRGDVLREIDVLGARPSNICFGGSDGKTVCVTEVEHGRLVRFRVEHPGRQPRFSQQDQRADWIDKIHRWDDTFDVGNESLPTKLAFRSLAEWEQARSEIQSRFEALLGPMPAVGQVPAFRVLSEDRIEGVIRKRIRIQLDASPEAQSPMLDAYLLLPEALESNDKRPGLIALHPTNNMTIDEIAGVGAQGPRATGLEFAKLGYVVICPKCFLWQDVESFDQAVANHRTRNPESRGIAKMVYDAQRAVDVLLSVPQVDRQKVFAFGHSLGAKEVLYLMAKDSRVVAGVASEGGVDLKSTNWEAPWYLGPAPRLEKVGSGGDWGHEELLALIAPRPILVMGGERGPGAADGSQSIAVMRQALPVWKLFQRELEGKNPTNSRVIPGLALWNHGQGHLFGDWQWEHAQGWFSAIESGQR
jgi:sugar lactone lactonase YvrE/dienelactone hydrolase